MRGRPWPKDIREVVTQASQLGLSRTVTEAITGVSQRGIQRIVSEAMGGGNCCQRRKRKKLLDDQHCDVSWVSWERRWPLAYPRLSPVYESLS